MTLTLPACDEHRGFFLKQEDRGGLIVLLASQGDAAFVSPTLVQVCMASDETFFKLGQEDSDGPSFVVEALHLELTIGVHSTSRGLRTLPTGREWLQLSPLTY
ncbi:hypothetical protein J7E70_33645 [Variovorax paradoxus]|nr:hypothetical protein [Variovorax paradoxus]MBT2305346.1 hypothetical protein [Variovorax paradoxus]